MSAADALRDARAMFQEYPSQTTFEALFRAAVADGRPLDSLDTYDPNEERRFHSQVIQGPDGHCYWMRPRRVFRTNQGSERNAARWWYFQLNGEQGRGTLRPVCGDAACIHPHHQVWVPWSEQKRRWTDEQMIGFLQVAAQRLGHSPSMQEWNRTRREGQPSADTIQTRFGGWMRALEHAGLPALGLSGTQFKLVWTEARIIEALSAYLAEKGHKPRQEDWTGEHRSPSVQTIVSRIGSWNVAWNKATAALNGLS